jgi:hypothetical protein
MSDDGPICMVKKTAVGKGGAPIGEEVFVFLPVRLGGEWSDAERRHRAWRIFGRDRPDENPMDWEVRDAS